MASTVLLAPPLHALPLHPASIAILFSVLLSVFLRFYFHPNWPSTKRPKLPPSPPKLPVIGNLHQLGPLAHHSLCAFSREHGPLMFLQLGQVPTLVVSSAEMAEEVLKNHDLAFASRPRSKAAVALTGGKGIGFAPYGEYWRQARKLCAVHLLSPFRVQVFRPVREEEVARLVGKISELSLGGIVNMSTVVSSFTSSLICRATMGASTIEEGTTREVTELVAQSLAVFGFHLENFFPSLPWLGRFTGMDAKLADLAGRWRSMLRTIVDGAAGRREARAEDGGFLDVLLSLQEDPTYMGFVPSRDEIEAILLSLINAGTDTSRLVLEAALEELLKNPAAMKKAQGEVREAVQGKPMVAETDVIRMPYLKAVIKETLRLHPSAPLLLPRESMKAVQMQGFEIPKKTRVIINAWAIARNPDYWESPEEFQPERFLNSSKDFKGNDFQFIPFGAGRRICPGMHFAMATIELALANLLYHFNWSLPEGMNAENFDTEETLGLTIHKRRSLLLVVKPNLSLGT